MVYEESSYPLEDILVKCASLSRLRVIFDDNYSFNFDIDGIIYYYNTLLGVDEHGYNLPHPYFSGTVNLEIQDYHTEEEITNYKNILSTNYPQLLINYIDIPSKFSRYTLVKKGTGKSNQVYELKDNGLFELVSNIGEYAKTNISVLDYTTLPSSIPSGYEF